LEGVCSNVLMSLEVLYDRVDDDVEVLCQTGQYLISYCNWHGKMNEVAPCISTKYKRYSKSSESLIYASHRIL